MTDELARMNARWEAHKRHHEETLPSNVRRAAIAECIEVVDNTWRADELDPLPAILAALRALLGGEA